MAFIMSSTKPKCSRWALELSEYQLDIEYVKGTDNTVSDALSRAAIEDSEIELPILAVTRGMIAKQDVIERSHLLGHFGAQRTLELARLVNDKITLTEVQDYIAKCKTCVQGPHSVPKTPLGVTVTASSPWEIVHCDFVGPLPRSTSGFEYIFTLMDDLTRFVFAWPLRTATVYTTMTILDRLFSMYGPPKTLHSDNGSVFTAKDFASYCNRWNVRQSFTPIVRPQANPVERSHRTLKSSLQKTANSENEWDFVLPEIVLAHNSVPKRTTQVPPFYAMFGRQSSVAQLFMDNGEPIQIEEEENMREVWNFCRDNHVKAKESRQNETANRPSRDFNVGDKVALKTFSGPKFRKIHFQTGFRITKLYGDFLRIHSDDRVHRQTIIVSKDLVVLDNSD